MILDPQILRRLHYSDLRESQREPIAALLRREDALVVIPTGGGKSAIYQCAGLQLGGVTLVISPLIALMRDQIAALKAKHIPVESLHSARTEEEIYCAQSIENPNWSGFLYSSPEALTDARIAAIKRGAGIRLIAVDEAHCISEWGHEFRPAYRQIRRIVDALGHPPVAAVTATATPQVRADIRRVLSLSGRDYVGEFARHNIALDAAETADSMRERAQLLIPYLRKMDGSAICYVQTQKHAEMISRSLLSLRVSALPYHAGLTAEKREQAYSQWMANRVRCIVATSAFGMGIDKPDVRLITHFGTPLSVEEYYQQIGRAGRDGLPSVAVLLWSDSDKRISQFLARSSVPNSEDAQEIWEWIVAHAPLQMSVEDIAQSCPTFDREFPILGTGVSRVLGAMERNGAITRTSPEDTPFEIKIVAPCDRKLRGRPASVFEALQYQRDREWTKRSLSEQAHIGIDQLAAALRSLQDYVSYTLPRVSRIDVRDRSAVLDSAAKTDLDARFERVQARLDAMDLYCYLSSHEERMRYIVDYFK